MRIAVNGTELYFDVEGSGLVPAEHEMVARPTLLLLHGGPGADHSLFKPLFAQLSDVAQVVYLDQRGHGRSAVGAPAEWTLDTWADDIHAFCVALGIEQPIVLGMSFGGMVAMRYAAKYPDHPGALILASTFGRRDDKRVEAAFGRRGGPDAARAAAEFFRDTSAGVADYVRICMPLYYTGAEIPPRTPARSSASRSRCISSAVRTRRWTSSRTSTASRARFSSSPAKRTRSSPSIRCSTSNAR